jgi:cell division cycle protein 20 (cofactor of APC complex)
MNCLRTEYTGHRAATKAVQFCPWEKNLLATGGGSFDTQLKIWDVYKDEEIASVDTNS